jgi:hypothetical protein
MSNEYPPNLAAALALLQTKLPRITKSETANVVSQKGSYSYTYAGLADVSAQVLPLLGAVGLSFMARPTFDDNGRYVLVCTLMHTSGESREGTYPLPASGTPQALGSAMTYGRRYTLCAMTGVAPDEDDDGAAAEAAAATRPRTAQRRSTQPQATSERSTTPSRVVPTAPRASEPPLPGEEEPPPPDEAPGLEGPVTNKQLTKLHTTFNEFGVTEREDKLTMCGLLVRRELDSSKDLTKQEAANLIDTLDGLLQQDDPQRALDALLASYDDAEAAQS